MSAIVRNECYSRGTKVPFGAPTSLIFIYGLTSFFFKQRLLMWRIAQLAHEFTKGNRRFPFNPSLKLWARGQRGQHVPSFESHQSRCKFSVQLNRHGAEVDFKALEKL